MDGIKLKEITSELSRHAKDAVRVLGFKEKWRGELLSQLESISSLQNLLQREFPVFNDEVEFWENLWQSISAVRLNWYKISRAAHLRCDQAAQITRENLQPALFRLYNWARSVIIENAHRTPSEAHFQLGIESSSPDCAELLDRLEGLYESIKRQDKFPPVKRNIDWRTDGINFGIIYGGGWNVSSYSILHAACEIEDLQAFVAFDYPAPGLYNKRGPYTVRLANSGLLQDHDGDCILADFREPRVLHFACPHRWTGPAPHDIGIPVLRSDLTLNVVNNKHLTTAALLAYEETSGHEFNLITEDYVAKPEVFPTDEQQLVEDIEAALFRMQGKNATDVVLKPSKGEQARDVVDLNLSHQKRKAVEHCIDLALDSGAIIQERINPYGGVDYNWRVFVGLSSDEKPQVVGRFARKGWGDDVEMLPDDEMLRIIGLDNESGDQLLKLIDNESLEAFKSVCYYGEIIGENFPDVPIGGGGHYAVPYFLGIDLIDKAHIMEINGGEVAGMWTDDRLYPQTRGRTNRTVLISAREAGKLYKNKINTG